MGVPNCDYGFNVATAKYLIPLIVKLVRQDPSPTANNYGLSKATTETTTYTHKVTEGPIPWSANEVMLALPTVDAVGDVTITYSDWCTTPSCTDSTNPPGDVAANQGPGGSRTYVFRMSHSSFRTTPPTRRTSRCGPNHYSPRSTGCRRRMSDSRSGDPYSVFPQPGVQRRRQDATRHGGVRRLRGSECGLHPARQVHVVESRSGVGRLQRKTHRTVPGTATITARYDWSIPSAAARARDRTTCGRPWTSS